MEFGVMWGIASRLPPLALSHALSSVFDSVASSRSHMGPVCKTEEFTASMTYSSHGVSTTPARLSQDAPVVFLFPLLPACLIPSTRGRRLLDERAEDLLH